MSVRHFALVFLETQAKTPIVPTKNFSSYWQKIHLYLDDSIHLKISYLTKSSKTNLRKLTRKWYPLFFHHSSMKINLLCLLYIIVCSHFRPSNTDQANRRYAFDCDILNMLTFLEIPISFGYARILSADIVRDFECRDL